MRTTPTRLAALAAVAAVAAAGTACSSDSVGEAVIAAPAVGTYTLRTVNENPLPASVSTGSRVITFLADTLRLAFGGTYTETIVTQSAPPGLTPTKRDTAQVSGQWSENGSTVALIPGGSATFDGTNTITLNATVVDSTKSTASITQVFRR